jgi:HD-like signal output (HDOD) protein
MTPPSLAETLTKNLSIPTLPSVVGKIREMIEDPEVGIRDVGKSLAQDGPLSAKVLRIVNSSFYGLQQRCNSVEQAAAILGLRVLRNVVTQASVIQCFEHLPSQRAPARCSRAARAFPSSSAPTTSTSPGFCTTSARSCCSTA